MNKKIRFMSIRVFITLLIISIFITCQKDDSTDVIHENHIFESSINKKRIIEVDASTIPNILESLAKENIGLLPKLEKQLDITTSTRTVSENPFGTVRTDNIQALEDLQNNTTYTFPVTPYERDPSIILNLIVVTDVNGAIIKQYIREYNGVEDGVFKEDFSGTSISYDLNGVLDKFILLLMESLVVLNVSIVLLILMRKKKQILIQIVIIQLVMEEMKEILGQLEMIQVLAVAE